MQYHHLQTFITVADEGSFSKAAEKLFVSPSALAQQITTLEHSLNFKLFVRSYQGVKLTSAGEYFYPKAKQISALTESAIARGNQINADENAEMNLRIGLMSDNGSSLIQRILLHYMTRYPNSVLSFILQSIQINIEELLKDKLDFFESPNVTLADQQKLCFLKLTEYPAYCTISENHPLSLKEKISLDDLSGYHVLVPSSDINPAYAHLNKALDTYGNCSLSALNFDTTYPTRLYYGQDIPVGFYPWIAKGCRCIPLDWDEKCAFGLIYSLKTSVAKEAFLNIAKELFADGKVMEASYN